MDKEILEDYLSSGKKLMPLSGKLPVDDWKDREWSRKELLKHKGNYGWILGKRDLVIDIDPKNGGEKSFKKLLKETGLDLDPTVVTPSGGFHIYTKIPKDVVGKKFRKTLNKEYPGIDFLTKGMYCVIAGGQNNGKSYEWYDEDFGSFSQIKTPEEIIDIIAYEPQASKDKDDLSSVMGSSAGWPEEKVLEMLEKLDPSMQHDDWVKVGMALHDWDSKKGLKLWEDWSKKGSNYTKGATKRKWGSFEIGDGVTLGTITYMVKEVNFDELNQKVTKLIKKIKSADEKTLEIDIIPKIKKMKLDRLNQEKIAKVIQSRIKSTTDIAISIGSIRQLVSSNEVVSGHFIADEDKPKWCNKWVYVNSHTGFMNLNNLQLHKAESFNMENGKYIPSEMGTKPTATKYVADRGLINKVDSLAYLPTVEDRIITLDGKTILNTFNTKTVPIAASEYSEEGIEAINMIRRHIKMICGSKKDAKILTQWIAHNIQFPGTQILWSPVIQSIEGTGKSFFGELLRQCLGDVNVGVVAPTQVTSEFNGWASGVVVNILEELRVKGHNRYDAVNALKPLITDRMIQINDKGVKQFVTYNTANYLCFTNYKDAIPVGIDDRRWWIIFVPISKLSDISAKVGESYGTYFPKLFNALRENSQEVRKWLLEYEISDEFKKTKQAPMTDFKKSMVATEALNFEGMTELKELIEEGGKFYNEFVVSSSDVFEVLENKHPEINVFGKSRHLLLKQLGFSLVPDPVKVEGKTRRIWVKQPMSNAEIRFYLKDHSQKMIDSEENIDEKLQGLSGKLDI
ncbi:hypothetical protein EKK58_07390 [Candidatus Dependentiae bacterium]|nr:MAG: hypothetical protein EKK58_07390 [Candidatus Dependentiae bacterium]